MRRLMSVVGLVLLVISTAGCSLLGGGISDRQDSMLLTGRVVMPAPSIAKSLAEPSGDMGSEVPVKGATITVENGGITAVTDADGYFAIAGLSPFDPYVINAKLPTNYKVSSLQSLGSPSENPKPVEVSVATTTAMRCMEGLGFKSKRDVDFDKLVQAAKESGTVQSIVALIRRGESVRFDEIGVADEIVDNFFRYYYPFDAKCSNTYRTTVYNDEWQTEEITTQTLIGTGKRGEIHVADTDENVSAYKWINDQGDSQFPMWVRIEGGTLNWYHAELEQPTEATAVMDYVLKDKKLTELELETLSVEAGTFPTLKITTYSPSLDEHGVLWLAPGIGMVQYRGDQAVWMDGEFQGYFKYSLELIDY
ncbi:MAG: carboxypeptidase regulatory-like domain-containing protein [Firmicutes bacterium]|nr:carboxypeptidase regulatory-like domain-containing protein [Bacillota bacterium]